MTDRHVMNLTRLPGAETTLTIDNIPQRVVYIKVTPDMTIISYEPGGDDMPEPAGATRGL